MSFRALLLTSSDGRQVSREIVQLDDSQLAGPGVLVDVEYSSVNYKDGLCVFGKGRLVREYPHIPGIDLAGTVIESDDERFTAGQKVLATGWGIGERLWGGYSTRARVSADHLCLIPDSLTTETAMILGTAGFTAGLAVKALRDHGLDNHAGGRVLLTGAAGGVGTISAMILSRLGFGITAVTGRPELESYLRALGADEIIDRSELSDASTSVLDSVRWHGCIDAVGGAMLGRVLKQMHYGASVASVGLAGGAVIDGATVVPFLLRAVNLLGIDSVSAPAQIRAEVWQWLGELLDEKSLRGVAKMASLSDLEAIATDILAGKVQGRVVVDLAK